MFYQPFVCHKRRQIPRLPISQFVVDIQFRFFYRLLYSSLLHFHSGAKYIKNTRYRQNEFNDNGGKCIFLLKYRQNKTVIQVPYYWQLPLSQRKPKPAPLPHFALDIKAAAVFFKKFAANHHPQPCPLFGGRSGAGLGAVNPEEVLQLFAGHANAGIGNGYGAGCRSALGRCIQNRHIQRNISAVVGEFYCIGYQIAHNRGQHVAVARYQRMFGQMDV